MEVYKSQSWLCGALCCQLYLAALGCEWDTSFKCDWRFLRTQLLGSLRLWTLALVQLRSKCLGCTVEKAALVTTWAGSGTMLLPVRCWSPLLHQKKLISFAILNLRAAMKLSLAVSFMLLLAHSAQELGDSANFSCCQGFPRAWEEKRKTFLLSASQR